MKRYRHGTLITPPFECEDNEVWTYYNKDIIVSNMGRIYDMANKSFPVVYRKPKGDFEGYMVTYCRKISKYKNSRANLIHHIVWRAFNGEPIRGFEIDHINRDKTDNRLINLRLTTREQNMINSKYGVRLYKYNNNNEPELIGEYFGIKGAFKAHEFPFSYEAAVEATKYGYRIGNYMFEYFNRKEDNK